MTDVTVNEVHTIPSQNYISSFFTKLPTDSRFVRVNYRKIGPTIPVDKVSDNISFILHDLKSPSVYLLSDMLISCQITITKKDKVTLPGLTARVRPINCAISSLFRSCVMKINDIPVTGKLY